MRYCELIEKRIILEYDVKGKSKSEIDEMLHRLRRIIQTSDFVGERDNAQDLLNKILAQLGQKPEEPKPEEPKASAGKASSDGAFQVVFFGHFYDPYAGKRGSDKVWGWGVKGEFIYQFWGPNGKTPQVKRLPNTPVNRAKLDKLAGQKAAKGYDKISSANHVNWLKSVLERNPKYDG